MLGGMWDAMGNWFGQQFLNFMSTVVYWVDPFMHYGCQFLAMVSLLLFLFTEQKSDKIRVIKCIAVYFLFRVVFSGL